MKEREGSKLVVKERKWVLGCYETGNALIEVLQDGRYAGRT